MSNHLRKPFYRRKRFWAGVVLAPVIITLAGWVMIRIDVQQGLKAARADGLPTSNAELEQYYQLPPDCHDSTQQWLDAMAALCTPYPFPFRDGVDHNLDDRFSVPCVGEVWENEQLSREVLTGRQAALQDLYAVAAVGGAIRFPSEVDEDGFWYTRQVDRASPADTTALLHLDAAIAARDNKVSRAVLDIETILALGKATRFEVSTNVINQHVKHYPTAAIAVVHCAPEKWTDEDAERIQIKLHKVDFHRAWLRYLKADLGASFDDITQTSQLHHRAINQRELLKFYHTTLNPVGESWWQANEQHWQALTEFEERYDASDFSRYVYRPFARHCPNDRLITYLGRCDTERQCAIVVLAMARHRLRHGSYPQTASDIDGDLFPDGLPRDPWLTTSKIKVLRTGDAFTVYGVGEDGVDDGGKVEYDEEEGQPPDVGFVWKPVSAEPKRPQ